MKARHEFNSQCLKSEQCDERYRKYLRDYFAAKAMNGILSCISNEDFYDAIALNAKGKNGKASDEIARMSYGQADAMLKAREENE